MAPPRNRRPGFSRRAQYGLFLGYVLTVGGAAVGAVLLLLSLFNPPAFAAVRGAVAELTTPIASGLDAVRRGIAGVPDSVTRYFGVVSENQRLKQQLEHDASLVREASTLKHENQRLRALLKLRDRSADTLVAARLVASSSSSARRYATLNAGARHGVKAGQPVRGPLGLIGQVVETGPHSARVLLIVDPESIVPVRRTRDGVPAIIAGRGDGLLDVRSASVANMAFKAGDTFVTSGTGGVFPPDIPVARVIRDARDIALARPAANPDSLDFALVMQAFLPPLPPAPPAKK